VLVSQGKSTKLYQWAKPKRMSRILAEQKMNTYIAMFRGVNVSGQKKIAMDDLRGLCEALDLVNVRTYVQSGNVVFESEEQDASIIAKRIETQIQNAYGYIVPVIIRRPEELRRIIGSNPFLQERNEDPAWLHVTFLYETPSEAKLKELRNPSDNGDEFSIGEKEIFLYCPNGYGTSKLSNAFFERKLGMPTTTRNWRTVNALYQMVSER